MRTFAAFRVSMHAALYLTVASLTCVFVSCPLLPFAVLAAILTGALLATGTDKKGLRVLFMLLPLIGFLPAADLIALAVAAVPAVYAFISIVSGRRHMEVWEYRREMRIILVLMFLLIGAILLFGYSILPPRRIPPVAARSAWVLLFLAFCFGFIAQRAIRSGNIRSRSWQIGNIAGFLLPIAAAAVFGVFARFVLFPIVKYAGYGISLGLMYGLVGLSNLIMKLYSLATSIAITEPMTDPPLIETAPPSEAGIPEQTAPPEYDFPSLVRGEINWPIVLTVLLILAVIVIIIVLVCKGRTGPREYREEGLREYGLEDADRVSRSRRRKRREKASDNNDRLRSVYRQYLGFLRLHGIIPERSETSGEISEAAAKLIRETDEQLRTLYRKARYDSEPVTDEEVRAAEEAYERIVADENLIGDK